MNFATCELCNELFLREHEICYIDGNPRNKRISNIAILCSKCTEDVQNFENSELILRFFLEMQIGKRDYEKISGYLMFQDRQLKLNATDLVRDKPYIKEPLLKRKDPWMIPLKKLCNLL